MMAAPRFYIEGWLDEDTEHGWKLKEDAPGWAKEEFHNFMEQMDNTPDENGMVTLV